MIMNDDFFRTAGYNAYVLRQTAFHCPYNQATHKKQMLLWLDGFWAAKKSRAYNCK